MRLDAPIEFKRDRFTGEYLGRDAMEQRTIDEIMQRGKEYLAAGNIMYAVGAFYKAQRKQDRLDAYRAIIDPVYEGALGAILKAEGERILRQFENIVLGTPL